MSEATRARLERLRKKEKDAATVEALMSFSKPKATEVETHTRTELQQTNSRTSQLNVGSVQSEDNPNQQTSSGDKSSDNQSINSGQNQLNQASEFGNNASRQKPESVKDSQSQQTDSDVNRSNQKGVFSEHLISDSAEGSAEQEFDSEDDSNSQIDSSRDPSDRENNMSEDQMHRELDSVEGSTERDSDSEDESNRQETDFKDELKAEQVQYSYRQPKESGISFGGDVESNQLKARHSNEAEISVTTEMEVRSSSVKVGFGDEREILIISELDPISKTLQVGMDFPIKRFDSECEPELYSRWLRSEKSRVTSIRIKRLWTSIQNYFWPTKVPDLIVVFTPTLGASLNYFGLERPVMAVLCSVVGVLGLVHLRQLLLIGMLKYKQWMLEVKPSWKSKLWFGAIKFVSSSLDNWYSGNWLLPGYPSPPPLKQSVSGFVTSMQPCVSKAEFDQLEIMAHKFLRQEGPSLHRKLRLKALMSRNWLAQWWIDYGYLASRSEVYRGFMNGLGPDTRLASNWMDTAALIVYGTYDYFVHKLATRQLPPLSVQGVIPMEMEYLKNITGGCRVPLKGSIDSFMWTESFKEAYCIVHIKGRYFKLYLHDSDGQLLSPVLMSHLLKEMYDEASKNPNEMDPCMYSYLKRDRWAEIHQILRSDAHNEQVFQSVARSAFVIHLLDGIETFQESLDSIGDTQLQMWCDRSLNIVVNSAGYVYICCEHSHCDAVLLSSLYSDLFLIGKTYLVTPEGKIDASKFSPNTHFPDYKEIRWNIPRELSSSYQETKQEILRNPNLKTRLCFKRIYVDKSLIKVSGMGPDSFFQSVIFWAYYKKHRKIVNAYQPGTLMFFRKGRTENTRPVNRAKVEFVTRMEDDGALSDAERVELLRKSANFQHQQTRLASVGQGCDRHLFGLYLIAKGTGVQSDFLDYVFSEGMDFPLCTSVCPTTLLPEVKPLLEQESNVPFCSIGGQFRPMEPNQYGIVYMTVCGKALNVTVTDLECSSESNAFEMGDTIEQCFYQVFDLLTRLHSSPKMDRN